MIKNKHKLYNNTKINNNNYENGFGDVSRYPLVRFKITDDGLK